MSWRDGCYLSNSSNSYWKFNNENKLDEEKIEVSIGKNNHNLTHGQHHLSRHTTSLFFKKVASYHFILKTQPTVSGSLLRHVLWKNVVFEVCAPIHVKHCAEADFSGLHFLSKRLKTVPSNLWTYCTCINKWKVLVVPLSGGKQTKPNHVQNRTEASFYGLHFSYTDG